MSATATQPARMAHARQASARVMTLANTMPTAARTESQASWLHGAA